MSPALKEKDGEFLFDEAIRHFKEGHFKESNDCAQQATVIFNELVKSNPHKAEYKAFLGNTYNILGISSRSLGNYELSLEILQKAQSTHKELMRVHSHRSDFRKNLAYAMCDMGISLLSLGKFAQSLKKHEQALTIREELYHQNPGDEESKDKYGYSLHKVATSQWILGNFNKALLNHQKALQIRRELLAEFRTSDYEQKVACSTYGKGLCYWHLGNYEESRTQYQEALSMRRALFYRNPGNESYEKNLSYALLGLGQAHLSLKEYDEANECLNEALESAKRIHSPKLLLNIYNTLGELYKDIGLYDDSEACFEEALTVIENLRGGFRRSEYRESFLQYAVFVYENIIDLLITRKNYEKALEYLERTKSRNLVEMLAERDICPEGVSAALQDRYKSRRSRLKSLERRWLKTDEDAAPLEDEYNYAREEYDEVLEEIRAACPEFVDFLEVEKIAYSEIEGLLKNERTALLEFYVTQRKICAFAVIKGEPVRLIGTETLTLPEINRKVDLWLKSYRRYIRKQNASSRKSGAGETVDERHMEGKRTDGDGGKADNTLKEAEKEFARWTELTETILALLQEHIFAEIWQYLSRKRIKKIYVIPHRALNVLPLHAVSCIRREKGKEEKRYLIQDFEISYSPSANVLKVCQRRSGKKAKIFIVLSDPGGTIPYARDEVRAIKELFDCRNCESREYDRATIKQVMDFIRQNTAIHFCHVSAHAFFNPREPLRSALYLTDEKNPEKSQKLTLEHIFTRIFLRDCSIVVLSACETGMITVDSTDEFIGFSSGFLYAGASSVVSTLWSVSDMSSALLMERFYKNIRQKRMGKAEALRKAQLWMLRKKNSPAEEKGQQVKLCRYGTRFQIIESPPPGKPLLARMGEMFPEETSNLMKELEHPYHWAAFCCFGAD